MITTASELGTGDRFTVAGDDTVYLSTNQRSMKPDAARWAVMITGGWRGSLKDFEHNQPITILEEPIDLAESSGWRVRNAEAS